MDEISVSTYEEWLALTQGERSYIINNLKQADKLKHYLESPRSNRVTKPEWKDCPTCIDFWDLAAGQKGLVLVEPRYQGLHPSQLHLSCDRRIWFDTTNTEKRTPKNWRQEMIYLLGNIIHRALQDFGHKGAFGTTSYVDEQQVSKEMHERAALYDIEGAADAVATIRIENTPMQKAYNVSIMHEYKSASGQSFSGTRRAKPDHLKQASTYAWVLNLPLIVFLYVNKETGEMVDFVEPFNPSVWGLVETRIQSLMPFIREGRPPPAFPSADCRECGFRWTCPEGQAK